MNKNKGQIWNTASNIITLVLVFALLISPVLKSFFSPDYIVETENRFAQRIDAPTLTTLWQGEYQSRLETALTDQFPKSEMVKKDYNRLTKKLLKAVLGPTLASSQNRYVAFDSLHVFGGEFLVYHPTDLSLRAEKLAARADYLNRAMAQNPQVEFFVYYVEKDNDVNFETGENAEDFAYLSGLLQLDESHIAKFETVDFNQYQKYFFRTDHHWNHLGAYKAYTEIMTLLGNRNILSPAEEVKIAANFAGSKSRQVGATDVFYEDFFAYRYDYPALTVTICGESAPCYGNENAFQKGTALVPLSYASYYGEDRGEVILSTDAENKGNLLLLGESYDNALLNLLASSHSNTYSVDLRHYEREMGYPFNLSAYVQEHEITQVLFIGSNGYFTMEDFDLGDS